MIKILKDLVEAWANEPAEWHQFWMPQSGSRGGALMGVIIASLFAITFFIIMK